MGKIAGYLIQHTSSLRLEYLRLLLLGRFCHENKSSEKSLIGLEATVSGSHRG